MSRGVCMTRAPVVRVRSGWGGNHLRYLAVKSAVRYWAITILPLDSSLTLMEWVEEVFKSLSIGGWQIWEGVPPPQLLLVCYEQLPTTIQGDGTWRCSGLVHQALIAKPPRGALLETCET